MDSRLNTLATFQQLFQNNQNHILNNLDSLFCSADLIARFTVLTDCGGFKTDDGRFLCGCFDVTYGEWLRQEPESRHKLVPQN